MQCKSLWIKASAKCINVNVHDTILVTCGIKSESFCHYKPSVSSILPFAIHCCMALGLLNLPCFDLRSLVLSKTVRVFFLLKAANIS